MSSYYTLNEGADEEDVSSNPGNPGPTTNLPREGTVQIIQRGDSEVNEDSFKEGISNKGATDQVGHHQRYKIGMLLFGGVIAAILAMGLIISIGVHMSKATSRECNKILQQTVCGVVNVKLLNKAD